MAHANPVCNKETAFCENFRNEKQADIEEVALLGLCDRLGRGKKQDVEEEIENMNYFIEYCKNLVLIIHHDLLHILALN